MMFKNSNDGLGLIHVPVGPRIKKIGGITYTWLILVYGGFIK